MKMRLFNFFKKNKSINSSELDELLGKMTKTIFPNGGQKDIEERTNELVLHILNNKVDMEITRQLY